jgi:hypothetical protein
MRALPWVLVLALVISASGLLLVLAGCTRTRAGVQFEELHILANWIEDTTHGIPRRTGELELLEASAEYRLAAQWVAGSQIGDQQRLPPQIVARITRAAGLAAALRSHVVLIDGQQGLVGPAPGLSESAFLLAAQIADAENRDRRTSDALVLSRCRASVEAEEFYRQAVRTARVALDTASGGQLWQKDPNHQKKNPDQGPR